MNDNRLENFPVSFFAMVMGMAGITIAWQKCATLLHFGGSVYALLVPFTLAIFAVLSVLYGFKLLRYRKAVSRPGSCTTRSSSTSFLPSPSACCSSPSSCCP